MEAKEQAPHQMNGTPEGKLCKKLQSLRKNHVNGKKIIVQLEAISENDDRLSLDFCKSYIIELLKNYCKTETDTVEDIKQKGTQEDKVEFILAIFRLLDGYDKAKLKGVGKRYHKYYKDTRLRSSLFVGTNLNGASIDTTCRTISDRIFVELTYTIIEKVNKNNGKLGLIEKVPKELLLPKPRYCSTSSLEEYMKQEHNGKDFSACEAQPYESGLNSEKFVFESVARKEGAGLPINDNPAKSQTDDNEKVDDVPPSKCTNAAISQLTTNSKNEITEEQSEVTEIVPNEPDELNSSNPLHPQETNELLAECHENNSGPANSAPVPDDVDEGSGEILEEGASHEEEGKEVTGGLNVAKDHPIETSPGESMDSNIPSQSASPNTLSPENPTSSTGESQVPVPDSSAPNPPINHQKEESRLKKLWDRFFGGIPQKEPGNSFSSFKNKNTAIGSKWDKLFKKWRERVPVSRNIGVDSIPIELWILILVVSSIAPMYIGCSKIFDPIDASSASSPGEIISSANPNNEVNLTREQFMVRDDDMSTIINDAREPIVLYTESGDYDVEAMRELIYERIVNNPIYGDMIIRGIMEADSFSRDQIGPHNLWMKRFLEETNVAEDKAKTYDPYMGQWLIKAGNLVSTNDDYKNYAGFLCGVLNYFDTSGGVHDFKSTCCWSIDANASGTHAHAERVDGNSVKSALVFRSGFMNGETGYLLAFSLEDGSLLFHNPWMWGVDSFLMEETPGMISAGWGDSGSGRPSYTSEEVAAGALGDKIVFNSISNGYIGDEKNFIGARNETDLADNPYGYYEGNYIHVEDGKEYRVRLYVHNNNPGGERRTAENVRVGFGIPWVTARNIAVNGFLSSSNAYPDEYWDGMVLMADQNFHLEYVEGSAIFENGGFASTGNGGPKPLSDDIVTDPEGILIGYSDYDGQIPGGNEYECAVSLLVKVVFDSEDLLESKVRTLGADTWNDDVEVDVGNILEFRVRYENISYDDVIHSDVLLQAALPEGLEYMDGSAILYSKDNSKIGPIDMGTFIADGINIGNYASGEGAYILYNAKVVKGNLPDGYNKIINWASCSVNKKSIADYSTATLYKTE